MRGSWRPNKDCNILTPTLLAITAFLSSSSGLLNRGHGGPASARTWFSFQHLLFNSWTSCRRGYIIIWRPSTSCERHNFALNSTPLQSRSPLISWYLRPDAPVIYTGEFLLLTDWPGRRSICNNIHTVVWTQSQLGRNPVLFYRRAQIPIWSNTIRPQHSRPSLGFCCHIFF